MNDPWKYIAFPVAAVAGYMISLGVTQQFTAYTGLSDFVARVIVIGGTGFVAGFMVDEVIPAYIQQLRSGGGGGDIGGGGDFGGGDDDFDLD